MSYILEENTSITSRYQETDVIIKKSHILDRATCLSFEVDLTRARCALICCITI